MKTTSSQGAEKKRQHACGNCRKKLRLGDDFIETQDGVIGPRGPVPLGGVLLFCTTKCVSDYFQNGISVPPRIP